MTNKSPSPPKVFISYSWTSEDHTDWVADLGERLMNDGIVVVLDQWDLKDGQDLNDFMEQMVKDSEINRVIIVSDSLYAAKADNRKGGVGTETQIISQEVYESVDQTKFVPVICERDEDGKPCLPIYLKSRKYIDFSDPDNDAGSYEQLLRNIYDRPRRRKPALGTAPTHIFDESATVVTSAQKAKRFREFVASGRGNPSAAFDDFAEEFLANFEELRMTYSRDEADTWCERIRANIESATAHRDVFVDVVIAGAAHLPSQQFMPPLLNILERILPYQRRPASMGSSFECSEDNYKLLCYELFLYSFAAFIKARKFAEARQLIDHHYVAPATFGGNELEGHGYTKFNNYARSLDETCAVQGNSRRFSVMADLVHDRALRKDLRFSDVMQADILLWMASVGRVWYPRTILYASRVGKCELFLRAVTEDGFRPLKQILNLNTPQEMLQLLHSEDKLRVLHSDKLWQADVTFECINLEQLKRCWTKQSE